MPRKRANRLMQLSPSFDPIPYSPRGGRQTFEKRDVLSADFERLVADLTFVAARFNELSFNNKVLITARFKSITPKSRRPKRIFRFNEMDAHMYVVGSKYYTNENTIGHEITYFVSIDNLNNTLNKLKQAKRIVDKMYNGKFTNSFFGIKDPLDKYHYGKNNELKKTEFFDLICDVSNIENFIIQEKKIELKDDILINFYSVFENTDQLIKYLKKSDILGGFTILNKNTLLVRKKEILPALVDKCKYLICQQITNVNDVDFGNVIDDDESDLEGKIREPSDEPEIGVFDSYFDENCYFSKWVTCVPCAFKDVQKSYKDKTHGTAVANILVEGPKHNKWLEDDCGNFRVKLFEVSIDHKVDFEFLYCNIERIVRENRHIKVWNMSLGGIYSVNMNRISLLAEKIDYISKTYDVIFVVSGTNLSDKHPNEIHVGAPADSLNSIVVNSVVKDNDKPASYTRVGPVLTLFTKPDISYYGGEENDTEIMAYSPAKYKFSGTSFAAPWVSRKLAYLIHYLHLSPLVAKALIIDDASKWDKHEDIQMKHKKGYGVPSKSIKDIIYGNSDEIKFVISDVTIDSITRILSIPVPMDVQKSRYYYDVKATICYYTSGDSSDGVDYSDIELDFKFGPIEMKVNKKGDKYPFICSVNKDNQHCEGSYITEQKACIAYQKWNNTKHLIHKTKKGFEKKEGEFWGLSITQINRFNDFAKNENRYGTKFGLVITLHNSIGEDFPLQSFVHRCVENRLNPIFIDEKTSIKLYNEESGDLNFEK